VPSASRSAAAAASDEDGYISFLLAEIKAAGLTASDHVPLRSVYFGGGTPSLTSAIGLERILNALQQTFGIADGCEITCEMDPATFDAEKASAFKSIGVTRASVGAQSFNDDLLRACGRTHSAADIYSAISTLGKAGIGNVSLDLISGLPGQSMEVWRQSLEEAVRLRPAHVSVYDLTLEKGTRFGRLFSAGTAPLPAEAESANMLTLTSKLLRGSEYIHYEVSNFALKQCFQSAHNMAYWKNKLFYAFGLGSTSLTRMRTGEIIRFARPRGMSTYAKYCLDLENIQSDAKSEQIMSVMYPGCDPCSPEEILEDTLINGMRLLIDGVDLTQIAENHGAAIVRDLVSSVRKSGFEELGLTELLFRGDLPYRLRLTEEGAIVENSIVSTLLLGSVWKPNRGLEKVTL
jgi:putative oxygen-independent coproporphyrinogen III oxidase